VRNKQSANAKINLCLHVTGQRGDGYHLLDSLVAFADFGDIVEFSAADTFSLTIDGPFGRYLNAGDDNLIARAAVALGCGYAKVHLTKNLPVSSGIGGGSADAAAALRGLGDLWNVDLPVDGGLSLGADVPVCLAGGTQRMQGIGDQLSEINFLPPLAAVLVNSGDAISTPMVFNYLTNKTNADIGDLPKTSLNFDAAIIYLRQLRNDLQIPAMAQTPNITRVLHALADTKAALTRMSGSGATCFGLYENTMQAAQAAQTLSGENPNWWVKSVTLNSRG